MGEPARQLPLAFEPRRALGREDFLVTPANAAAVAWIDRWPDWPAPVLVIWGGKGSGKSHLAAVFGERTGSRTLSGDDLIRAAGEGATGAFVIDGLEAVLGMPQAEEALFHLHNRCQAEPGSGMLITAALAPNRLEVGLADLRSRLLAAPAAEIAAPDEALLSALLVKQFQDRQLTPDQEVIDYLVARMERTFGAAAEIVNLMDQEALAAKRRITVPLARQVLGRLGMG